jgi:hypothetical protein
LQRVRTAGKVHVYSDALRVFARVDGCADAAPATGGAP